MIFNNFKFMPEHVYPELINTNISETFFLQLKGNITCHLKTSFKLVLKNDSNIFKIPEISEKESPVTQEKPHSQHVIIIIII